MDLTRGGIDCVCYKSQLKWAETNSKLRRAASLQDKALSTEIFRKCSQLAKGLATPDARLESSCTWCMGRKTSPRSHSDVGFRVSATGERCWPFCIRAYLHVSVQTVICMQIRTMSRPIQRRILQILAWPQRRSREKLRERHVRSSQLHGPLLAEDEHHS